MLEVFVVDWQSKFITILVLSTYAPAGIASLYGIVLLLFFDPGSAGQDDPGPQ